MKLLIDADFTVYKCCAASETEMDFGDDVIVVTSNFSEAYACVKRELAKIEKVFGSFDELILFFSSPNNFRKKIYPDYKGHRNRKKPCGYKRVIEKLKTDYRVIIKDGLEADDSMGVYATKYPGNIIVSPDKDMKQIPGQLYNFEDVFTITKSEGEKWHLTQSAAGDNTDGYAGIPGVGIKKATQLFEANGWSWKTLVDAFADKDLGEDIALQNARLAKILTAEDYDFDKQEPILWDPCPNYQVNN